MIRTIGHSKENLMSLPPRMYAEVGMRGLGMDFEMRGMEGVLMCMPMPMLMMNNRA